MNTTKRMSLTVLSDDILLRDEGGEGMEEGRRRFRGEHC